MIYPRDTTVNCTLASGALVHVVPEMLGRASPTVASSIDATAGGDGNRGHFTSPLGDEHGRARTRGVRRCMGNHL